MCSSAMKQFESKGKRNASCYSSQRKPSRPIKRHCQRKPKTIRRDGRWDEVEHHAFLLGLQKYGRDWRKFTTTIPTRTSAQIRSHAQKYLDRVMDRRHAHERNDQHFLWEILLEAAQAHSVTDQLLERHRLLKEQLQQFDADITNKFNPCTVSAAFSGGLPGRRGIAAIDPMDMSTNVVSNCIDEENFSLSSCAPSLDSDESTSSSVWESKASMESFISAESEQCNSLVVMRRTSQVPTIDGRCMLYTAVSLLMLKCGLESAPADQPSSPSQTQRLAVSCSPPIDESASKDKNHAGEAFTRIFALPLKKRAVLLYV